MKNKQINIEVPEGFEIDKEKSTFEKIIFVEKKNKLPMSWNELRDIIGYYISSYSAIVDIKGTAITGNKNIFPTKEYAEAALALAQLLQLRQRWLEIEFGSWQPDFKDDNIKFCIINSGENIEIGNYSYTNFALSFPNKELALKFKDTFIDLLETAKPLL